MTKIEVLLRKAETLAPWDVSLETFAEIAALAGEHTLPHEDREVCIAFVQQASDTAALWNPRAAGIGPIYAAARAYVEASRLDDTRTKVA